MKKLSTLLMAFVLLFSLAGCGADDSAKETPTTPTDTTKEADTDKAPDETADGAETDEGDVEAHYPVTITTYNYAKEPVEITFEKAPERVIAVYQNSIETLLALGLEDKIVAASGLDHEVKAELQPAFENVTYYDQRISKEEVIGLQPDFILSWFSLFGEKNLGDVSFWHERDINTYMAQNSGVIQPNTLDNEYEDILNIGKIFDVEEKAEAIVENMKAEIASAQAYVADKEKVKTVILEVQKDGVYRIYGEDSIGGDIATKVGADLVARENGKIGSEDLVALNPEVIFTVYYGDEIVRDQALESLLNNEGLKSIQAIENGRVHPIMLSEVYASGIRTLDGIQSIIKGLYPEK